MKYLIQIIVAAILITIGKFYGGSELRPELVGQGVILVITVLITELGLDAWKNRRRLRLIYQCWLLGRKNEFIRFSMSYQYRIKVNDKYLLVKNSNWDFYQHVGGKYKRLPVTQKVLKEFGAIDDLKLPTNGLKKDDLAVFIPAKNAVKFIDWFNTCEDREISHWREFYEELIDVKGRILSPSKFPYVNYEYKGRIRTPLKKEKGWDCMGILQYDVLDLIPTPEQQIELENLLNQGDTDYVKWADNELIQALGTDKRTRTRPYEIGAHAKWVVNMQWCED